MQAVLKWAVFGMPECAGFSGTWLEKRVCKLAGAGWKQTSRFSSSSGHIGEMRVWSSSSRSPCWTAEVCLAGQRNLDTHFASRNFWSSSRTSLHCSEYNHFVSHNFWSSSGTSLHCLKLTQVF